MKTYISILLILVSADLIYVSKAEAQSIAFTSDRYGNGEIYVMNADGSNQKNLTNNLANEADPIFSPDGSKISFMSSRDGNWEIYVMNSDGSNQKNLTNNPSHDHYPSWSPEGSKIAFHSDRNGNNEIYVMNSDGSNLKNLTNNLETDVLASWSPDGSKIVFETNRDGNYEIYVMDIDGSNQTRLTNSPYKDWFAEWSPDGSIIAFSSDRGGNFEIYVMNSDGTNLTRLTNNSKPDYRPSWSFDGSKIVFDRFSDGNYEIYVMNSDGTNLTRLTSNPANDLDPSWFSLSGTIMVTSPNGSENWAASTPHNITWKSNDIDNVKIEYSINGDSNWVTIVSSINSLIGSYLWTVPNTLSNNCLIKITYTSALWINDQSDEVFTISQAPTVTLILPTGDEPWIAGTSQNIIWSATKVNNVKLEYSTNAGSSWITIVSSTDASVGSYLWLIPDTPSDNCVIKITDTSNASITDQSNIAFSLTAPEISLSTTSIEMGEVGVGLSRVC